MDLGKKGNQVRDMAVHRLVERVENGENLMSVGSAIPALGRAAFWLTEGNLNNLDTDIWDMTVAELKEKAIGAQIYSNRGDLGSGVQDGPTYLHVFRRGDQLTNAPFAPLEGYQERVLRATTEAPDETL